MSEEKSGDVNPLCMTVYVRVLFMLWGHKSVYAVTSWGLAFLLMGAKLTSRYINYSCLGLELGLGFRLIFGLGKQQLWLTLGLIPRIRT